MATHHPGEELLLDYASGSMREPLALLVATHLALCPECRRGVARLEDLGGHMIDEEVPAEVSRASFDHLMARIERGDLGDRRDASPSHSDASRQASKAAAGASPMWPRPLRDYIGKHAGGVSWQKITNSVAKVDLLSGYEGFETRLLRLKAGSKIPTHTHAGREFLLVLEGGFSDAYGHYLPGDVSVADSEVTHQPVADDDGDCICLAVTDAPLRFTGPFGSLINLVNKF